MGKERLQLVLAGAVGVLIGVLGTLIVSRDENSFPPTDRFGGEAGSTAKDAPSSSNSLPVAKSAWPEKSNRAALASTGVNAPTATSEPPLPIGIDELVELTDMPTAEELEARFGTLGIAGLKGAEAGINWVLMKEVDAILKDKLARGEFITRVVDAGEPVPQEGTFPDGSPRIAAFNSVALPDGTMEMQIAEMRPTENPLVQARMAELEWIALRLHELETKAKNH